MRFKSFLFFSIMVLALAGCNGGGNEADAEESVDLEYSFEANGQEFEIIHAYQLYDDFYAEGLKGEEATDYYNSNILDGIADRCFKGGEFEQQADYVLAPPKNRIAVQDNLKRMDSIAINKAIKDALTKSSNELPIEGSKTTVCVFPTDNNAPAPIVTAGVGQIVVLFDRNTTNNLLKASVANKYHHSYWVDNHYDGGESFTILDRMVMEGKGMMFQKLVYPNIDVAPVDETYNKDLWTRIEGQLETEDDKRAKEILQGGKNGLPSQYGLSESYKMVKAYAEANDLSLEDWTAASSQEILEAHKANYN